MTEFVMAGEMVIAEYVNGTLARRYIPGPGVDQRIAMLTCLIPAQCNGRQASSAHLDFYSADRQGHVLAVTRRGADQLMQRFFYTPFGVEMQGDPTGNPFRYTGRYYDAETGLYYYRARYYDADLGRFLSVDPIGYADQWNLYAYVGNSPLNATDPSGKETEVRVTVQVQVAGSRIVRDTTASVTTSATLSDSQTARLAEAFSDFIAANNGADLSGFGKTFEGGDSESREFAGAVSEFAGYAAFHRGGTFSSSWSSVQGFRLGEISRRGREIPGTMNARVGAGFGEGQLDQSYLNSASPTDVARTMIHESLHLRRGFGQTMRGFDFGYNDEAHYLLEYQAQYFIHSSGLGLPSTDRWGSYLDHRYSVVESLNDR